MGRLTGQGHHQLGINPTMLEQQITDEVAHGIHELGHSITAGARRYRSRPGWPLGLAPLNELTKHQPLGQIQHHQLGEELDTEGAPGVLESRQYQDVGLLEEINRIFNARPGPYPRLRRYG